MNGIWSKRLRYVSKLKLFGHASGLINISALGLKEDKIIKIIGYRLIEANKKAMI